MSTTQNLMFLERQLEEYLHEHTVDENSVLWVTDKGFRLPYSKTRDFLEQNMKFIETQLEQYLHEHDSQVESGEGFDDPSTLAMGDVGNFEDTVIGTSDQPFWWQSYGVVDHWAISDVDPRNGSKHLAGTGGSTTSLRLLALVSGTQANPDADEYITIVAEPGQRWTWRGYFKGTVGDASAGLVFDDSDRNSLASHTTSFTTEGEYTLFSVSGVAPDDTASIRANFFVLSGATSDHRYDDWELIVEDPAETTVLYISNVGFRFPYGWDTDGKIRDNVKFLETEISTYLHKHEAGFEEEEEISE